MDWSQIFTAIKGITYATGFILLWAWFAVSIQPLDTSLAVGLPHWLYLPGLTIVILGALIDLWCFSTFIFTGKGTPAPFDPPIKFIASGPYKYVRNPMYIGGGMVLLGAGLMVASLSIVLLALFFGLFFHFFVTLYEEPSLKKRFGASYKQYLSSVNRWWPVYK